MKNLRHLIPALVFVVSFLMVFVTVREYHIYSIQLGVLEYGKPLEVSPDIPYRGLYMLSINYGRDSARDFDRDFSRDFNIERQITREGRTISLSSDSFPHWGVSQARGVSIGLWRENLTPGEKVTIRLAASPRSSKSGPLKAQVMWEIWHFDTDPEERSWYFRVIAWGCAALISFATLVITGIISGVRSARRI